MGMSAGVDLPATGGSLTPACASAPTSHKATHPRRRLHRRLHPLVQDDERPLLLLPLVLKPQLPLPHHPAAASAAAICRGGCLQLGSQLARALGAQGRRQLRRQPRHARLQVAAAANREHRIHTLEAPQELVALQQVQLHLRQPPNMVGRPGFTGKGRERRDAVHEALGPVGRKRACWARPLTHPPAGQPPHLLGGVVAVQLHPHGSFQRYLQHIHPGYLLQLQS